MAIASTVEDSSRAVSYTDGSHGLGGVSTFRAITYPEKHVVAELVTHCAPSVSVYQLSGSTADSHCYYDNDEFATFVNEVRAGKIPRRHSSDPKLDAQLELDARFASLAHEMGLIEPRALSRGPTPAHAKIVIVDQREPDKNGSRARAPRKRGRPSQRGHRLARLGRQSAHVRLHERGSAASARRALRPLPRQRHTVRAERRRSRTLRERRRRWRRISLFGR